LGEYTALVFFFSFDFEDALKLVARRGQLMSEAGKNNPGTMVSIMGPDVEDVRKVVESVAEKGTCSIANLNCPGQYVISGDVDAALEAARLAEEQLGARTVQLKVSGAFHSALMADAQEGLRDFIQDIQIRAPRIKFVANVSAGYENDPDKIRSMLVDQVVSPVLWRASMEKIISDGVDTFYELGAGRVLRGLLRKIDRSVTVTSINSIDGIE